MIPANQTPPTTAKPRPAGSHFSVAVKSEWKGGWQAEFSVGVQTFAVGPEYKTFSEAQWMSDRLREALTSIAKSEPAQRSASLCCPDCEDTGMVGDQEAGGMYRGSKRTLNDEWAMCGCDPGALAVRNLAKRSGPNTGDQL